jgi:hypothetical protein
MDHPSPQCGPFECAQEEVGLAPRSQTVRPRVLDHPRLCREHREMVHLPMFGTQIGANTLFGDSAGDQVSGSTKNQTFKWSILKITPIYTQTIS